MESLRRDSGRTFENTDLKRMKLAVLGDSATQLLVKALGKEGMARNYRLEIFESDFNLIDPMVRDSSSDLYSFAPDAILLLYSVEALQEEYYATPLDGREQFITLKIENIRHAISCIGAKREGAKIVISNFAEINDGVYGHNANKYRLSFLYVVRRINMELMEIAADESNIYILDIALLQSRLGRNTLYDARLHVTASMTYAVEVLPVIARNVFNILASVQGYAKKCLILDLDNTVWGGIIGDDGVEKIEIGELGIGKAFTLLQLWAKELRLRGILLAICSKNTEEIAKEPFIKHPDMKLRLEDISVFVANWGDKVTNIRHIQSMLNIGFDSMVFIDDNRFERESVKAELPDVEAPDMPEDPAEYMNFLQELNLFEAGTLSKLDAERTKLIQQEILRIQLESEFENKHDFLQSMNMVCTVSSFNSFNTPRVAQLSQRSNQFNLRTLRYSEQDVRSIADNPAYIGMALALEDRLGDHGLISVIVLQQQERILFIENWFMSCRVLKRGVEYAALEEIVNRAHLRSCDRVVGQYLPTKKNELVKDHYHTLGFRCREDGLCELRVSDFVKNQHFIEVVKND